MVNKREQRAARKLASPRTNRTLVPLLVAEVGTRLSEQLPPGLRRYGDDITDHLVEQLLPPLPQSPPARTAVSAPPGVVPRLPLSREAPGNFTAGVMARISLPAVVSEIADVPPPPTLTVPRHIPPPDVTLPSVLTIEHRAVALPLHVRVHAAAVALGFLLLLVATAAYVLARTDPARLLAVAEIFGGIGFLVLAFGRVLMPLISLPLLGSLFALTSGATVLRLSEHRRQMAAALRESEAA